MPFSGNVDIRTVAAEDWNGQPSQAPGNPTGVHAVQPAASLTVSIVTYRLDLPRFRETVRHLRVALQYAEALGRVASARVLVIDNGNDTHVVREVLEQELDETISFEVSRNARNEGFGRGHNVVLQYVDSRYHLILNPDVLVARDSIAVGVDFLDGHVDVGLVSPRAVTPDGDDAYLCKRYPTVFALLLRALAYFSAAPRRVPALSEYEMHDLDSTEPTFGIPVTSGCCMLCRTEMLKEVEGFCPAYFMYFEDFDLSVRVSRRSRIAHLPAMRVVHYGGFALSKGVRHLLFMLVSGVRFFNHHGWRFW